MSVSYERDMFNWRASFSMPEAEASPQRRTLRAFGGEGEMHIHTMITAHSGCEGRPDNSLEYVRYALGCGADALEVDVHRRNGGFYISHDPSEDACPGLEEVFALVREGGMLLNCDLKEPGLERDVLELARSCGAEEQLLFSGSVCAGAMEEEEIRRRTFWNVENAVPAFWEQYKAGIPFTLEDVLRAAESCRRHGAGVVNIHYGFCTPEALAVFREQGIGVSAWTVNEEGEARRLLAAGVRNLTSRRPLLLRSLRDGERHEAGQAP